MIGATPQQQENAAVRRAFLILVVEAFAFSVEVFLRRGFGGRYIDRQAALAAFLIPGFKLFWQHDDTTALDGFYVLFLLFAAWEWSRARWRYLRGDTEHSRYSGWPRLLRAHLHRREPAIKKYFDPFAVVCVAFIIGERSLPLASYLLIAGVCLFLSGQRVEAWMRRRVTDLNDAVAEQQQVGERFRALRGD